MGKDLIPAVDNINTFDTTLEVETYNGMFTYEQDSARSIFSDVQYLGLLTDPFFGKTDAQMFFQLVPRNGKFTLNNVPGKRYIDSVVLNVRYVETYGDSTLPQTITVSELSTANNFVASGANRDSAYSLRQNNFMTAGTLGSNMIFPFTLNDSITEIRARDTTKIANRLRIKLSNTFGQRLLDYDTSGVNDAYSTDSIFLTKFAGFALKASGSGNSLLGFSLPDTNTRLTVYYHYDNATTPGDIDTAVADFILDERVAATANYIGRNYSGTPLLSTVNDNVPDQISYIQNSPGLYSTLKIPGLKNLKNNIIHLAELQMEQVYDSKDTLFNSQPLFVDVYDSTTNKYKTIPYALEEGFMEAANQLGSLLSITGLGYRAFGSVHRYKNDAMNNRIKEWKFNLTRYVQYLVKGSLPHSSFRLYTTHEMKVDNGNPDRGATKVLVRPASGPAKGRVRLGGGNHPTQKMKLRIVYSRI